MNNKPDEIKKKFNESINIRKKILNEPELIQWIIEVSDTIVNCLKNDGKILFAGNGGSFADSQHIAAEFVGRFMMERGPLASICLGTNSSSVSAIGNDYGFDQVFSREISCIGKSNDVFIAISTSGNSNNLITAIDEAKKIGMKTYGLLGKDGGQIVNMISSFVVPSNHTARIQEIHITVGHILCDVVDNQLFSQE